jgi:hypothetical protein
LIDLVINMDVIIRKIIDKMNNDSCFQMKIKKKVQKLMKNFFIILFDQFETEIEKIHLFNLFKIDESDEN